MSDQLRAMANHIVLAHEAGNPLHQAACLALAREWLREHPQPSGPTVRVRIAVAVNEKGEWNAAGSNVYGDKDARAYALEGLWESAGEAVHFIEATLPLPLPQSVTVQGVVTPGGEHG